MIVVLRIFFAIVGLSMVAVTSWAGLQVPLWSIPRAVGSHPWFIATLFDAYWGFFTFFAWVCYKETRWRSRILWFGAIVLLGNMAMAAYGLAVTLQVPTDASPAEVLLRGRPVSIVVPLLLLAAFVLVSLIAAAA
ncbi:MAG TPA: DUF1475 family protein [Opitutaceae bacterium]|nr:DUF1475 family protein [Opitutaceae bacterium]